MTAFRDLSARAGKGCVLCEMTARWPGAGGQSAQSATHCSSTVL